MLHTTRVSTLALALLLVSPAFVAVTAEGLDPNHDITDASIRVDATNVYFDVTVAGTVEPPVQDVTQFRIDFGVQSAEEAAAGSPASQEYFVDYGSASDPVDYYLFKSLVAVGVGSKLAVQPDDGVSTITFTVPRASLTTLANQPLTAGSALVGILVRYQVDAETVDEFPLADFTIPAVGGSGFELHLAGSGVAPFVSRALSEDGPTASEPRFDVVALGDGGAVSFVSSVSELPFEIDSGQANLWMSFTTTTPVLALNVINAKVFAVHPDGSRELLGERLEFTNGDNPNIFTTPGQPQLMQFPLAFSRTSVPAGSKVELQVSAPGLLGLGDMGPALLYYGSTSFDSTLRMERTEGDAPLIPVTDPPLGNLPFHLRGDSGDLTLAPPTDENPDGVLASGEPETLAVWETAAFTDAFTFESATVEAWISSLTTTPAVALNFLDARLYVVDGGVETLVAQRPEYRSDANPNVFTTPGQPLFYTWSLAADPTTVPAGASLRLKIVADALTDLAPGAALVWSDSPSANSRLVLRAQALTAEASPAVAETGENVTFTGTVQGGIGPYAFHWDFGDGASTAPATTPGGTVTATHAYSAVGSYTATLVATDSTGAAGGATVTVGVSAPTPDEPVVISDVGVNPFLPELGKVVVTWKTDQPGNSTVRYGLAPGPYTDTVTDSGAVLDHSVTLTGLDAGAEYVFEVETSGTASDPGTFVTAGDFNGDSVVVVAFVDSGINPYHETFRRPDRIAHPATYVSGFPATAEALPLTFDAATYNAAVAADQAVWDSVEEMKLYWIPGTNIIGARDGGAANAINGAPDTRRLLDDDGHGTNVAGTITRANPDVLLVVHESTSGDPYGWIAEQDWIDAVSVSVGNVASVPGIGVSAGVEAAHAAGKVLVGAAGNTPNPHHTLTPSAYPQFISVGGADPDGFGEQAEASKFADVVSDYRWFDLPTHTSLNGYENTGGTSFATPNTAGTLSKAILELRQNVGQTDEGTADGLVRSATPGTGALDDGKITNVELREALNVSAVYWDTTDWDWFNARSDTVLPIAPTPWVQMGWGYVSPDLAPTIACAATASCPGTPEKPEAARLYLETIYETRKAYYSDSLDVISNPCAPLGCDDFAKDVSLPGPEFDVRRLDEPIHTPHPYPDNAELEWTVSMPGATAVSVHFENFSMETGFDFVELYDGDGTLVALLGGDGGASFWSPYVPGETVTIRLVSDGGVHRYGFDVYEVDVYSEGSEDPGDSDDDKKPPGPNENAAPAAHEAFKRNEKHH